MAGNPIFGAGQHAGIAIGRQQVINELAAALQNAQTKAAAQRRQNRLDTAATVTGSVLAEIIPVVYRAIKAKRQSKRDSEVS